MALSYIGGKSKIGKWINEYYPKDMEMNHLVIPISVHIFENERCRSNLTQTFNPKI